MAPETRSSNSPLWWGTSRLRSRILAWVLALVFFSGLGSALSVIRLMEVHRSFEVFQSFSGPISRTLTEIQNDALVIRRELDRRASHPTWGDHNLRPRSFPVWALEELKGDLRTAEKSFRLLKEKGATQEWVNTEGTRLLQLAQRFDSILVRFEKLESLSVQVQQELVAGNWSGARQFYQEIFALADLWGGELDRWCADFERMQEDRVSALENTLGDLRTGLVIVLMVVMGLSVLLLWFGERALRPLERLSSLAREISQGGGLRLEHKRELDDQANFREDEVGELTSEFRRMAANLLEREKMILTQKKSLEDQNRRLQEMGALNQGILDGFRGMLIVFSSSGQVLSHNAWAKSWCEEDEPRFLEFMKGLLQQLNPSLNDQVSVESSHAERRSVVRVEKQELHGRVYSGTAFSLSPELHENVDYVVMLEDVTESLKLEERVRSHEHLVSLGRMSAQIAHEVRNPLHSVGLEAEMAMENLENVVEVLRVPKIDSSFSGHALAEIDGAKQCLASILSGVDRLEKVTEKYLKLSREDSSKSGAREASSPPSQFNLVEAWEAALAFSAPRIAQKGVQMDWSRTPLVSYRVIGDQTLVEQALGNLLKNALEALDDPSSKSLRIWVGMGVLESGRIYLRFEDDGPGIQAENSDQLFKPFFTTKASGTGLGLSFVRQVMDASRGEIRSVSPTRLQGAAFELLFQQAVSAEDRIQYSTSHLGVEGIHS